MRFTFRIDDCWIGIALRSQGYLAGNGTEHLVWVGQDGVVNRTGPAVDARGKDEHKVGCLADFESMDTTFVPFCLSMDARHWKIRVGDVDKSIPVSDLPHVFPCGRIMFQTFTVWFGPLKRVATTARSLPTIIPNCCRNYRLPCGRRTGRLRSSRYAAGWPKNRTASLPWNPAIPPRRSTVWPSISAPQPSAVF